MVGTASGYILIDLDKIQDKSFNINLNSITVSDLNANYQDVNLTQTGVFKNNYNNIDFTFSVAEFDKYSDTEYQYQLVGIDNHWSPWSKNASISFKYLPYGDYVFNVRAKTGNNNFKQHCNL